MSSENITVSRERLYEQVWSKPMIKLAEEYGMSDNGLRKICRKLNIPLPKSGHWQKLLHGKEVKKTPLPKISETKEITITPTDNKKKVDIEANIPETMAEYLPKNQIKVPDKLKDPHPLIQRAKKTIDKSWRYRGLISTSRTELHIKAGPDNIDRAIRIMDTLIKALAKRKLEVFIRNENDHYSTCVKVFEEIIAFDIYEVLNLVKKEQKDSWVSSDHDYVPSGRLILRIKDFVWDTRKQWADGQKYKLEDCLNSFICGLYKAALIRKQQRQEIEQRNQEWKERLRQAEQNEQHKQRELEKIKDLEEDALNWHKSQIVKSYIEAAVKQKGEIKTESEFENWLNWAKKHADNLDPLTKK